MSKHAGPRQSTVSAYIDPKDILNQVLDAELDNLSAGQLLAISPVLSNALIKVLKLKNANRTAAALYLIQPASIDTPTPSLAVPNSVVAATFINRDHQHLIRLQVVVNGKTVITIVDTGSMLNVVLHAAWRKYMPHVSMNITCHINMGDVNGGQAQLRGYLKDVMLNTGSVESFASF
ncbi:hypothetical protein C8R45DRAFT_1097936 [Mycena sanguinolenta]|nr:hypothetical protein C8R45DRAFT_1097936 [Mycena sanguinolenta]